MSTRLGTFRKKRDLTRKLILFTAIFILIAGFTAADTPNCTISLISTATWDTDQEFPALWQDRIVWQDLIDNNIEIILYNSTSGEEKLLTHGGSDEIHPDIYENLIVWENWSNQNYDLMVFDLNTGVTTRITDGVHDQVNPSIWGPVIAFEDNRGSLPAIFYYDMRTGDEKQASGNSAGCSKPDVWGNYIVWEQDCGNNSEIFLFSISNTTPIRITYDPDNQMHPSIWEDRIIWVEDRDGYTQISLYNITTGIETNLTSDPWYHGFPVIFGDFVTYENQKEHDDISLKNIVTGEEILLTPDTADTSQNQPAMWENRIVWRDGRDWYYDIYLCTLGVEKSLLTADFLVNETQGLPPLAIEFTDTSTGDIGDWDWNFGDDNTTSLQNPLHVYQEPGIFSVILTVHNPYQRAAVRKDNLITAGTSPSADFSADVRSGPGPLAVHFSDNSGGYPTTRFWDFGDGTNSTEQNPDHLYTVPGVFDVSLYAENQWGNDTLLKDNYITVMDAVTRECVLPAEGIQIQDINGSSHVALNTSLFLPVGFDPTTDNSSVACVPGPSSGIAQIRFFSLDEFGFSYSGNDTIGGNISGLNITSVDYRSANQDPESGLVWLYNYSAYYPGYDMNGKVTSRLWEGATPDDSLLFETIAINHHHHVNTTAFTLLFAQDGLSNGGPATITFGIDSGWIMKYGSVWPVLVESDPEGALVYVDSVYAGHTPVYVEQGLSAGTHTLTVSSQGCQPNMTNFTVGDRKDNLRIIRVSEGGEGSFLNATFLYHDNTTGMDYFSAASPEGFSKFGVVTVWQEGSPIQMLYLTLQRIVAPSSGGDGGGGRISGGSTGGGSTIPATTAVSGTPAPAKIPVAQASVKEQGGDGGSREVPHQAMSVGTRESITKVPVTGTSSFDSESLPGGMYSQATFNLVKNVSVLFVVFLVAILLYLRFRREA